MGDPATGRAVLAAHHAGLAEAEWTAVDTHGNRELAGMPKELVRGFSKRTDQIDAELERLAADGQERTLRLVKWTVQATANRRSTRHRTSCMTAAAGRRPSAG